MSYAIDLLKNIAEKRSVSKDDCITFGERVALKFRKFDEFTRSEVQHKINCLLYETEMKVLRRHRVVPDDNTYNYTYDTSGASMYFFKQS